MNSQKIKGTLFLPKTTFPLKNTNYLETESKIRQKWKKQQIYRKILEKNQSNSSFILHDGPTYANDKIHVGHVLNHILKDIIVRFYALRGYYTPFILGLDTHGLPIEHKVLQLFPGEKKDLRKKCDEYASQQVEIQKKQLEQLGLFTDYDKVYLTKDKKYEAKQIRIFAEMVKKNLVYQGWRPIYWSCSHATALAGAEVEYLPKEDYSFYFYLELVNSEHLLRVEQVCLLIWTTQPWTIPANQFVAVKKEASYSLAELNGKYFLILSKKITELPWLKGAKIIKKNISGAELVGLKYYHPYQKKIVGKVIDGEEFVSEQEGSGILHCAPAFGAEDFNLARREKLTIICPMDEKGYFTQEIEISELKGKHYQEINKWVVEDLTKKKRIAFQSKIVHSYPHDWRDKTPLIYRLTEQWFINVQIIKPGLLNNIEKVEWHPFWAKEKMKSSILVREDWCISRQRKWGVPIPVLFNKNKPLLIPEVIDYIANIFEKNGSDCWFDGTILPQLQEKFPQLIDKNTKLGTDIMDVWLDSGVSHWCVLQEGEH